MQHAPDDIDGILPERRRRGLGLAALVFALAAVVAVGLGFGYVWGQRDGYDRGHEDGYNWRSDEQARAAAAGH